MRDEPREDWPDLLLLLGDQVYADEGSPGVREYIRATRGTDDPPGEEIANFEEYTRLYRESWGDPEIRWLLSTVSSAMVIDDHDMHDDWNISRSWLEEMEREPWWRRARGQRADGVLDLPAHRQPVAATSSPSTSSTSGCARRRTRAEILREFAEHDRHDHEGTRWSFCRDLGGSRLIVMDSRAGRVLEEGRRSIFDDEEWDWISDHARGDFDHLLIGTSDPFLLSPGLHHLEAWSESVCDGAWGPAAARLGEKVRRALDLDHWAAFQRSFGLPVGAARPRSAAAIAARRRRRSRSCRATSTTRTSPRSASRPARGSAAPSTRACARRFATRSTAASSA